MKFDIKNAVNRCVLSLKQHSPEILVVTGIVGTVAGAVMACRATLDLPDILEEHGEAVKTLREKPEAESEDTRKALAECHAKTGLRIVCLYGPSAAVGALSIAGILVGNDILRRRYISVVAAYAAVSASFETYRGRVVERYGKETDLELRHGLRREKITETVKDENGKEKKEKREVYKAGGSLAEADNDYARVFAYGEAKAAEPNADYNDFFLRSQQNIANNMLRAHGLLYLNEVYDMLGIERSVAGQSVGWVYDRERDDHGDNYVNFRIQEVYRKRSDEPGDYERVFLIDPNVDGVITDHALRQGLITR